MIKINIYALSLLAAFNADATVVIDNSEQPIPAQRVTTTTEGVIINNITVNAAKPAQPIIYVAPGKDNIPQQTTNNPPVQELMRQRSIQNSNRKATHYSDQ